MIMESFGLWQLGHFLLLRSINDIIRLMLCVIMYFIFYFSIKFAEATGTHNMFAVYFVCLVPHIHLTQAFVLKPREARVGKRQSI